MNNTFSKKQILFKVIFSFSLLVFLVIFFKAWQNASSLMGFVGAYSIGVFLLYFDEQFLYKFYTEKIDLSSQDDSHFPVLASRNFLFLLILPFLSIFVFTSSGSILGIALILAINFYLLIEMWQLRDEFLLFKERFLSTLKTPITAQFVRKICWFVLAYFVFLLIVLIL